MEHEPGRMYLDTSHVVVHSRNVSGLPDQCARILRSHIILSMISRILSLGYWSVCREMHVLSAKQLLKYAGLKDPSQ